MQSARILITIPSELYVCYYDSERKVWIPITEDAGVQETTAIVPIEDGEEE